MNAYRRTLSVLRADVLNVFVVAIFYDGGMCDW